MRKSRIQKLAVACIAACTVLGGIGAANAQMHDGSHAGGDGGFHGGGGSRGGGFHGGDGRHHEGGNHHDGRFHGRVFVGPPIIFGSGYYPYGYSYPYPDDSSSYQWYCSDPAGYYPDVQTCPSGWLQVVPNG
jgi:hypothetical protein